MVNKANLPVQEILNFKVLVRPGLLLCLLLAMNFINSFGQVRIPAAHSHNDYEQNRPLFDAIDCNFISFEADVFSVGDSLYVAHNFNDIKTGRTLQQLYLEPLINKIVKNNGSVYGNGEEVTLFIDIKDDALRTYQLLNRVLSDYQPYLSSFNHNQKKQGCIMVVVSGNRPIEYMKNENMRLAGYDGRLEDLDSGIDPGIMPVISDNWVKYFSWNGIGQMPEQEKLKLLQITKAAKVQGYILRFWGTPNRTAEQRQNIWTVLSGAGVGLIGVDELVELRDFLNKRKHESGGENEMAVPD
jgi:hypothetical protein